MAIEKILLKLVDMLFPQFLNLISNIFQYKVYSIEQAWFEGEGALTRAAVGDSRSWLTEFLMSSTVPDTLPFGLSGRMATLIFLFDSSSGMWIKISHMLHHDTIAT